MPDNDNIPSLAERSRIIGVDRAAALYGQSITNFRRMYRSGRVPAPIKISLRKLGWPIGVLLDDIATKNEKAA